MGTQEQRFAGPLAAAWPAIGVSTLQELLLAPAQALPVSPASQRQVWAAQHVHAETLQALRERAEADLASPWPQPLAHDYARYFRDGDRNTYEQAVFARQQRLSRATVLAAVTLDPMWIDEVTDGVTLLCEQSSWCWPAHDDTKRVHGAVVPTVTDPYLDLGAGEVASQLAWLDYLLAEQLDEQVPGLRARIRHEVRRRVLAPFTARRDWHWLGLDGDVHNWNPWIHGNVLVAALRLEDDLSRRAELVDLVIEGLDRYVASLPADGAIDEGYSYWWNGACRALEALDVLAHATGGALTAAHVVALRETVAFPHRTYLGGPWYLNHADGPARPSERQPWDALYRAAGQVGDPAARAHAAMHRLPGEPLSYPDLGLGRLLRALTDPDWAAAASCPPPLPRDVWFESTQVLLARSHEGSAAGLTLAAKGGHNGEHHNHNDVGSVVVALGGVPVLVDAGRPTYTAQTFGPDRYDIWTMQSAWHNVPQILGSAQEPGPGYAARGVAAVIGTQTTITLDIAQAYPRKDIHGWKRVACLDREAERIVVTDSWQLAAADGPTRVQFVAAGQVSIDSGRVVISALDDAGDIALTWEPAHVPCAATVRELDDPMLSNVWGNRLTRLEFDVTALGPAGTFVLTVREGR
ncbi:heparinase [Rhizocola hellebori]|uniref:Heparinase n=1 Tax=Rhizocola hellebori TaxID=1392758 RepID=A0A8J3Q7G0_9ACTN|nr:heparinase II/III family protein [Rhizocola hellebori]GIH05508.1 heparinase [Rhizocola hellebori]